MNLIQFGHSLLTGEWRLQRDAVREHRDFLAATRGRREMMIRNASTDPRVQLYAGAESTIDRPPPRQLTTPEDYREAYERIVLIRAARQIEEDHGFFDGLLEDFEQYVIGDCAVYLPNTGNKDADKVIREYLEWQFDEVDYSQRLDLTKIAQLAVRSFRRDGECGFNPIDVGDSIKIRYYSGDCIGNPMLGASLTPGDYNGILADTVTDAPVTYRLFKRLQKMNAYALDREIPADHFWHLYDPFRFQQYHGVSTFKNAIRDAFDIDQILEFTKQNIKFRSSQLPTIHNDVGRPRGAGINSGYFGWGNGVGGGGPAGPRCDPKTYQIPVDGVVMTYLKTDDQVVDYPHDFPNAQLQVSIEEFRRQCCKGAKIPYEFAYRAENGGVVQRFWVEKALKTFAKDKHLVKRVFLNRYKNRAIKKGIETGFLDLSSFGDLSQNPAVYVGQWQLGSTIYVDYGKENDTDIKLIEAGLMSPQDKAASDGRNLDEVAQEIEQHTIRLFEMAERIATKTGKTVEQVMPFLVKKYPNPPANTPEAGAMNPAPEAAREPVKTAE